MNVLLIFAMLIVLCVFPSLSISGAKGGLDVCLATVIPSLFPFFVVSKMFVLSGGATFFGRYLNSFMKFLFNISGNGASSFVIGIVSGYPVGAMTVCDTYNRGEISKQEAQNLLGFCNNSGPGFIIGAIGTAMLKSYKAGCIIYVIHVLSAVTLGIFMRAKIKDNNILKSEIKQIRNKDVFTTAVEESIMSIMGVCGYVIIFSVLINAIKNVCDSVILTGFFEMTTAIKTLCTADAPIDIKIIIISMLCGWSGLSVNMQVKKIISKTDLSFKKYVFSKISQCGIAFFYSMLFVKMFPNVITASKLYIQPLNFSSNINVLLIISLIIILLYITKWGRTRCGTFFKK